MLSPGMLYVELLAAECDADNGYILLYTSMKQIRGGGKTVHVVCKFLSGSLL
jgi:hypothetical protein